MATHSSIFAWRIPWTEETGSLQSMGSQRVGHFHFVYRENFANCKILIGYIFKLRITVYVSSMYSFL